MNQQVSLSLSVAVERYNERFRHSFVVHGPYNKENWAGRQSATPGCYALYTDSDDLLYIGKASNTRHVGHRLWHHFKNSSAHWMPFVASIQIVEVTEAFEAPSLEEYLVRELQPRHNGIGIRVS